MTMTIPVAHVGFGNASRPIQASKLVGGACFLNKSRLGAKRDGDEGNEKQVKRLCRHDGQSSVNLVKMIEVACG